MTVKTHKVYIGVGSNMGERQKHMDQAKKALTPYAVSLRSSPVYETDPVGGPPQGKFLNAVWEIETSLGAEELFEKLKQIERESGRVLAGRNEPRPIDLDLLFYDQKVMRTEKLTIPHPRLHERWFVLKPLSDLNPNLEHPVLKQNVRETLDHLA